MKKHLLVALLVCMGTAVCFAAKPKMACESLFVESLIRNEKTDVSIITSNGNYFRSLTVSGDKKIVDKIVSAMEADRKIASSVVETFEGKEGYKMILTIPYGGYEGISVGFDKYSDTDARIFISGPVDAFK